jgi:hypothetical protein
MSRTKWPLNGPVAATPGMKPYHERGAPIIAAPFRKSASASNAASSAQRARGGLTVNIVASLIICLETKTSEAFVL